MADVVVVERRSQDEKGRWMHKVTLEPLFLLYGEIEELRDFLFSVKCGDAARAVDAWLDKNDRR